MAIFKPEGADNNNFFPAINNLIDELQKGIVERIRTAFMHGYAHCAMDMDPDASVEKVDVKAYMEKFYSREACLNLWVQNIEDHETEMQRIKDSLVKQMTDAGYSPEEIEKKLNA